MRTREEPAAAVNSGVLVPPGWATELVDAPDASWRSSRGGIEIKEVRGDRFGLVSARVAGARNLDAAGFESATRDAYLAIGERLQSGHPINAVRVWNFIPGILEPLGSLPHRYMAFNAGRFRAYEEWYSGSDAFRACVPTASGVGHLDDDLTVHCLASSVPGNPVENPRQVPSYRYSERYGPIPPCFARATRVVVGPRGPSWLLVGGTASVRGEETVHPGNLATQAEETFDNLAALVAQATDGEPADRGLELAAFRYLRVYFVEEEHATEVRRLVESRFAGLVRLELLNADLCRSRLLVEIEGVAELARR